MSDRNFTATITVDNTPEEAFAAITDVRGWWNEVIDGDTASLGDEFTYEVPGVHRCHMTLTEVVPGRRMVWHVTDSSISFVENATEWDDTDVVFEILDRDGTTEVRFTHVGLRPADECYNLCSDAWTSYITGSLRNLITTGTGEPIRRTDRFDIDVLKQLNAKVKAG